MLSDKGRILVVDGDGEIATALHEVLSRESYHVDNVHACTDASSALKRTPCDLILLDLGGEGLARIELMKQARRICPETSVVIVTAHPTVASAVIALRYGAHDYLIKPLRNEDLKRCVKQGIAKTQRIRREKLLLTRLKDLVHLLDYEEPASTAHHVKPLPHNGANGTHSHGSVQPRDIIIDQHRRRVRRNGQWIGLTPTEFALLAHLVNHAGEVQGYRKLVSEVQGYEADEWEARNLIKYYVHCLRKKLEPDPTDPRYILNVRGVGYLFSSNGA
jgi:DNA-binding response OmpR family regulator